MDQGSLAHFVLGAVFVSSSQSGVDHGRRADELDAGLAHHVPILWLTLARCCQDQVRQGQTPFLGFEDDARLGEAIAERYAAGTQSLPISPVTMLGLLLLRKFTSPAEHWNETRLPRRLICTFISGFDSISDDHGLNTAIGKTPVLPMNIRVGLLAGLTAVIKDPLEHLPQLRAARISILQFDAALAQDPIINLATLPNKHFTCELYQRS
jgi:hypothetical protein